MLSGQGKVSPSRCCSFAELCRFGMEEEILLCCCLIARNGLSLITSAGRGFPRLMTARPSSRLWHIPQVFICVSRNLRAEGEFIVPSPTVSTCLYLCLTPPLIFKCFPLRGCLWCFTAWQKLIRSWKCSLESSIMKNLILGSESSMLYQSICWWYLWFISYQFSI